MHDDLCPCINKGDKRWCECALIAKVRADERERWKPMVVALTRDLLDHRVILRAQVEALPGHHQVSGLVWRDEVLALLDGATDE